MKHRLLQGAFLRITLSLLVLPVTFMSLHAQGTDILDISAGATAASGSYAADKDFSGGTAAYTATTVTTTGVTNPAPEAVYQNQRYGNFTYTLPGFTSGTTYLVRLHMSEFYWTAAGKREFNVLINGTQVLTNFDIYATAGGEFKAVVEQFNAVANSSGDIVIQFVSVIDNAAISGIETESVTAAEGPYPGPSAPTLPGTVLAENYDTGGQGVAYNVTSTNGTANTYRAQGVDLEAATAPATANNLGWTAAGQWFKYSVNVATAGTYTVSFLVAAPAAVADGFHISNSSGTNLSGSVNVPATGGYQTWVTVTATVTLPAGTQTLTVNQDAAGWNVDSMAFANSTPTVATPTFSPGAGTYTSSQSVTISDATSGATIYYTTNNTTPSSTSTKYSGPISVTASETLKAIAELSGDNNSAVATAAYTISASTEGSYPGPSAPTLPGTVLAANYDTGGQGVAYNVTSVNGTANCGGRTSSVDSEAASSPATGCDLGWTAATQWFRYTVNPSTSGTYTVSFLVAAPAAVADGFHISNSLGTNLSGSVNVPATGGYQTWVTVTATVTLPAGTQTLTVNQDAAGWNVDSMAFANSTPTVATPTFSPGAGTYTGSQSVTISDATSGATIYYTTNNTTPSSTSTKYTGPISVAASETIEAIAELSGENNSAVATAAYTISASTVATPTFSPGAGSYTSSQSVTINDATSGASCYYTLTAGTTGATPSTSSTRYTSAIAVTATSVLESLCAASGDNNSAVATAAYTISTSTGGYVQISNGGFTLTPQNNTALVLDNSNWGIGAGNPIDVLTPNESVSQAFALNNTSVTPAGDYNFGVQGANCMSASGTTSGSAVVITGCGGTPAQAWAATLVSTAPYLYTFNNQGLCLTASGTGSGNAVVVDTCNGSSSQQWGLTAVTWTVKPPPQGPITNGGYSLIPQNNTGLMLDDSGSNTGAGNPINVTTPASSVAQNWALSDNGVTPLTYYNLATIGAYCMTASGTSSGSAVVLDGCAGTSGQAWEAVVSGSFYTFSPANNTALCLTASGTASGSAVVVDACNSSSSQQWALGPAAVPPPPPPPPPGECNSVASLTVAGTTYSPTWCTEFNSAAGPELTGYAYDLGNNGGWGNGEAEIYCGPPGYPTNPAQCPTTFSTSTAPVYIDGNGHLVIQPRCVGGFVNGVCQGSWLSGRLVTSGGPTLFTYGIVEASIQLPDMNPQGLWPAFWGLGNNINSGVSWPTCGETDILEDWSPAVLNGAGDAGENSTIHTMDTGGTGVSNRYLFPSGQAVNTGFHTYGMIWSPNEIQYFVDNPSQPFATLTPGSLPTGDTWPFNQSIFIILNEAVGGLLGGTTPTSTPAPMLVDYVRWYQPQ